MAIGSEMSILWCNKHSLPNITKPLFGKISTPASVFFEVLGQQVTYNLTTSTWTYAEYLKKLLDFWRNLCYANEAVA